jgi:hypothetical protein
VVTGIARFDHKSAGTKNNAILGSTHDFEPVLTSQISVAFSPDVSARWSARPKLGKSTLLAQNPTCTSPHSIVDLFEIGFNWSVWKGSKAPVQGCPMPGRYIRSTPVSRH